MRMNVVYGKWTNDISIANIPDGGGVMEGLNPNGSWQALQSVPSAGGMKRTEPAGLHTDYRCRTRE